MLIKTDLEMFKVALEMANYNQVDSPEDHPAAWLVFQSVKRSMLEEFPFKDFLRFESLTKVPAPAALPAWTAYALPQDFIKFDAILNPDTLQPASDRFYIQGGTVLTKSDSCLLRYVSSKADITSSFFANVLSLRVARDLTKDADLYTRINRTYLEQEARLRRSDALKGDNTFDNPQEPFMERTSSRSPIYETLPGGFEFPTED